MILSSKWMWLSWDNYPPRTSPLTCPDRHWLIQTANPWRLEFVSHILIPCINQLSYLMELVLKSWGWLGWINHAIQEIRAPLLINLFSGIMLLFFVCTYTVWWSHERTFQWYTKEPNEGCISLASNKLNNPRKSHWINFPNAWIRVMICYYLLYKIANCWASATEHSRTIIKTHHYQQEGWQQHHQL